MSDLAGCQRSIAGAARPPRRVDRSTRTRSVASRGFEPRAIRFKAGCPATGRAGNQSVSSEGLEPSPLRVKAAFSASRDPSSLSLLPSSASSSGSRGQGALTLTLSFERSTSRFVLLVCSFCFRRDIAFERRTSPASRRPIGRAPSLRSGDRSPRVALPAVPSAGSERQSRRVTVHALPRERARSVLRPGLL